MPLAFLPAVLAEVFGHLPLRAVRRRAGLLAAVASLACCVCRHPALHLPDVRRPHRPDVRAQRLRLPGQAGERVFYLGSQPVAKAADGWCADLGAQVRSRASGCSSAPPTSARRRTRDAYLYYLLPELTPATYYIEMDPGVANAKDSGLAAEVATSDWLVLSHVWDGWEEPNDSRKFGPDGPNQVVRRQFCLVKDYDGIFELYRRCRAAA